MKALFRNHFPFVEGTPEEALTPEQKLIKQTYDKLYPKEEEGDRLRDVHVDEAGSGAGSKRRRNGNSDTSDVLPNR